MALTTGTKRCDERLLLISNRRALPGETRVSCIAPSQAFEWFSTFSFKGEGQCPLKQKEKTLTPG